MAVEPTVGITPRSISSRMPYTKYDWELDLSGEGVLVSGKAEDRRLSKDNRRDDNEATRQKNEPKRMIPDGTWY